MKGCVAFGHPSAPESNGNSDFRFQPTYPKTETRVSVCQADKYIRVFDRFGNGKSTSHFGIEALDLLTSFGLPNLGNPSENQLHHSHYPYACQNQRKDGLHPPRPVAMMPAHAHSPSLQNWRMEHRCSVSHSTDSWTPLRPMSGSDRHCQGCQGGQSWCGGQVGTHLRSP